MRSTPRSITRSATASSGCSPPRTQASRSPATRLGNVIAGGGGNDTITGGGGRDVMSGGAGSDTFVFEALSDSVMGGGRDLIKDFVAGIDTIDLTAIDANAGRRRRPGVQLHRRGRVHAHRGRASGEGARRQHAGVGRRRRQRQGGFPDPAERQRRIAGDRLPAVSQRAGSRSGRPAGLHRGGTTARRCGTCDPAGGRRDAA